MWPVLQGERDRNDLDLGTKKGKTNIRMLLLNRTFAVGVDRLLGPAFVGGTGDHNVSGKDWAPDVLKLFPVLLATEAGEGIRLYRLLLCLSRTLFYFHILLCFSAGSN